MLAQPYELRPGRIPRCAEIADHDDQGSGPHDPACTHQGVPDPVSRVPCPLVVLDLDQRADEPERPAPSARDAGFDRASTGEHEPAGAVAAPDRGPGEQGSRLGRHHRLECPPGAEAHPPAKVHDEEDRALALLVEQLGMGMAGARGHPPVDVADVVAGEVDPRFRVFHPAPPDPRRPHARTFAAARAVRVQGQAGGPRAQPGKIRGGERRAGKPPRSGPVEGAVDAHGTATRDSSASTT